MLDLRPHCDQFAAWPNRRADPDITRNLWFDGHPVTNRESRQGHDFRPAGIALFSPPVRRSGHVRSPHSERVFRREHAASAATALLSLGRCAEAGQSKRTERGSAGMTTPNQDAQDAGGRDCQPDVVGWRQRTERGRAKGQLAVLLPLRSPASMSLDSRLAN